MAKKQQAQDYGLTDYRDAGGVYCELPQKTERVPDPLGILPGQKQKRGESNGS